MKTRRISTRILVMAVAVGMLAVFWAVWSARPAEATRLLRGMTGALTLSQGEAMRFHLVNANEDRGIRPSAKIIDRDGNTIAEFAPRMLALGETTTFEYDPQLMEGEQLLVRAEITIQGVRPLRPEQDIASSLEVFDTRDCCGDGQRTYFVQVSVPWP